MSALTRADVITSITTHYIDGAFVESHGRQAMDVIRPTDGTVIGRVMMADEEDTRRAIDAAKGAFATYGRSTPEERAKILRRLHEAAAARVDDLTAAMIEEYGGVAQFAGAEVHVGGEGHPDGLDAGYFVKPTVFVNVKNDIAIAQEEIFGPVLSVIAYDSEDDAIRIANDSRYGLHAAVIGTDLAPARRVAAQLRAGRVVINNMTDDPQAPWGGFKFSGVGREYGRYGIEAFLETKAILES